MVRKVFAVPAGVSIREFARRDGCSDALVRRALKSGHLEALADGTLDPDLAGTGWREANRRGANTAANSANTAHPVRTQPAPRAPAVERDETPAEAAERIVASGGADLSLAEAERLKENYLALLRQLEYDTKAALVVPVADAAAEVGRAFAAVRTRLLALPAEHAPRLHRLKTVVELQDALAGLVTEALEELCRSGALRTGA